MAIDRDDLYEQLDDAIDAYAEDYSDILHDEIANIISQFKQDAGSLMAKATKERAPIDDHNEPDMDDIDD